MIIYTHEDVLKMMNTFHTSEFNRDLCMARLTPIQVPQQEISDEEIEKQSKYWNETTNPEMWTFKLAWKAGAKWYREQLKNKQ